MIEKIGFLLCKYLKWHRVDKITENDGCSNHGICKYCGKEVMQDSTGAWF